jgi:histidinol-phosphate aminotransferase
MVNLSRNLSRNEILDEWSDNFKKQVLEELARVAWYEYPQRHPEELEEVWARRLGLADHLGVLFFGGIQSLLSTFYSHLEKGTSYYRFNPSFYRYSELERLHGVNSLNLGSQMGLSVFENVVRAPTLLCNPNNPDGFLVGTQEIKNWCNFQRQTILWDATYLPFSSSDVWQNPNIPFERLNPDTELAIAFSFSKAWALAGARIGYLILRKDHIQKWRQRLNPFELNHFSTAILKTICKEEFYLEGRSRLEEVKKIKAEAYRVISRELAAKDIFDVRIHWTETNFLLLEFENESKLLLFENAIVVCGYKMKRISRLKLRFSMPPRESIQNFLLSFEQVLASYHCQNSQ